MPEAWSFPVEKNLSLKSVQVRKEEEQTEPEPWWVGLGKFVLSKNVYEKMKRFYFGCSFKLSKQPCL